MTVLLRTLLAEAKDESAQVIADTVYKKLGKMQNFQLRDDFTIVIFKKDRQKGLILLLTWYIDCKYT